MQTDRAGGTPARGEQYSGLVSDVLASAKEREEAAAAASSSRRAPPSPWAVAALAALLAGLIALNAYLLTRPPAPLPPAEQEVDLRYAVAALVEEVEAFRRKVGRLPTSADLADVLDGDEEVRYELLEAGYRVRGESDGVVVVYDGSVPLARWVEERRYADVPEGVR